MLNRWSLRGVVFLAVMFCSAHAYAQTDNILAVGISTQGRITDSSKTDGAIEVVIQLRFGHDKPGWGWQYDALSWFNTGVNQPIDGEKADMGILRIRPFMGGYGYTWIRGRAAVTADLIGGYAITSFRLDPAADDKYRALLGARSLTSDAGNSLVAKPEINVWYDLTKRIGIRVSGGFLFARPTISLNSSLGEDVRKINADAIMISVGGVYKIF